MLFITKIYVFNKNKKIDLNRFFKTIMIFLQPWVVCFLDVGRLLRYIYAYPV